MSKISEEHEFEIVMGSPYGGAIVVDGQNIASHLTGVSVSASPHDCTVHLEMRKAGATVTFGLTAKRLTFTADVEPELAALLKTSLGIRASDG